MNIINFLKKSWSIFNWKLYIIIFLTLFIPILYRTSRVFFIGTLTNTWNFSIAANLQWINVMFEVLEEGLLLPFFFALRRIFRTESLDKRNKKITGFMLITSCILIIFIILLVSLAKQTLEFFNVQNISNTTIQFVKIETISRFFVIFTKIGAMFLIAQNLWKQLIIALIFSTIINVNLDFFISSNHKWSFNKGIIWIAYNQLIISIIMTIIYTKIIFKQYQFKISHYKPILIYDKIIWKQCFFSGLESFIRNGFFIWFVIKIVNRLDSGYNQGDFWVMSTFIWGWMLLPILALSQYMNQDQALNKNKYSLKQRLTIPLLIIIFTILIWVSTITFHEPFIRIIMNNNRSKIIAKLVLISIGFYIIFAINEPIDKILYGDGKAHFVLIQSVITNIFVFIPYYYLKNEMTINDIAIMMGLAIALDSAITFIMFFWFFKKQYKYNVNQKQLHQ